MITYYKPEFFGGNHEFKVGVDHLFSWFDDYYVDGKQYYQLRFNNGAPFQLATMNAPVVGPNHGNYVGVYGQDSWTIARRLTLDLGLRVEHDNAYAPAQCRQAAQFASARCWDKIQLVVFNSLAPRAHVAFDVTGDGKNVIKGGYAFQSAAELQPDVTNINENVHLDDFWDLHDKHGNRLVQAGEVNPISQRPRLRSITATSSASSTRNERQPKMDEFSLTFERDCSRTRR